MRIRRTRTKDAAAIARLHRTTIQSINSRDYPPQDIAAWSSGISAKKERKVFESHHRYVAVVGRKIVGFCDISKKEPATSWGLYVHREWIRKGVGSKLYAKIEEQARKQGIQKLKVTSTVTARPFYEAKGFKVIRKSRYTIRKRKLSVFIMEKNI